MRGKNNTIKLAVSIVFFVFTICYSKTEDVISGSNEYAGKTVMIKYNSIEIRFGEDKIATEILYYDKNDNLMKKDITYETNSAKKKGYHTKIETYDGYDITSIRYIFTDTFAKSQSFDIRTDYLNPDGSTNHIEYQYLISASKKNGYYKSDKYFDKGIMTNHIYHYTPDFAASNGYEKVAANYNNDEITSYEFFFTDVFAVDKGYGKTVNYYDKGKLTSIEYFFTPEYIADKDYKRQIQYFDNKKLLTKTVFYYKEINPLKSEYNREEWLYNSYGSITNKKYYMDDDLIIDRNME